MILLFPGFSISYDHRLAGHVGRHDVDCALVCGAMDLAVQPLPAVGLHRGLFGESLPFEGQDQVAVQRQREGAAGEPLQSRRTAGKQVQEHSQIDGLAHSGRAQHHHELGGMRPGADRLDHLPGQKATAAWLTLVGVPSAQGATVVAVQAIVFR